MTNTIGQSVLTLKWCASFLVSNVATQSIPAFSVCGIAEFKRSIVLRRIGLQDLILNLKILTFYMSHLLMFHEVICKSITNYWRLFQVHNLAISWTVN